MPIENFYVSEYSKFFSLWSLRYKCWTDYCCYYYYRKQRFRWHNVKRLQGHLTNTKQNSTSATQQNEQSTGIYQIQTAAKLSESGKLRANSSIFVLYCVVLFYQHPLSSNIAVVCSTVQNGSGSHPSYPQDNHNCSDAVLTQQLCTITTTQSSYR